MALGNISKQISRDILGVINNPEKLGKFFKYALGESSINLKIIDDLVPDISKAIDDGNVDEWIARTRKDASDEVRGVLDNPNFIKSLETAVKYDNFSIEFGELYIKGDAIDLDALYVKHGIKDDELREAAQSAIDYRQNFINEKAKELAGENGNPAEHMTQAKDAWADGYSKFIDEERIAANAADDVAAKAGAKTTSKASSGNFDPFPEFNPSLIDKNKWRKYVGIIDKVPLPRLAFHHIGAQRPEANKVLDPLFDYFSNRMNKVDANGFSMTHSIKKFNDDVLKAVEEGKSSEHIQKMINKFGKDNEAALKEFSENMNALRDHVEKTYKTNKDLTATRDADGKIIKDGTDQTRIYADFITIQKDATIKWLDHMTEMPLDLIKGTDGDLGKEMLHNAARASDDRILFNKIKDSVTGLSNATEVAIREITKASGKNPDGSTTTRDYINQVQRSLNEGFYLKETRGPKAKPFIQSTHDRKVKGNLAFSFQRMMEKYTELDENGNPVLNIHNKEKVFTDFIDHVDTLASAGNYAEAMRAIDHISHISYSKEHNKLVRNMLSDSGWRDQMRALGKYDSKSEEYISSDPRLKEFYKYVEDQLARDEKSMPAGKANTLRSGFTDEYWSAGTRSAVTKARREDWYYILGDAFALVNEKSAFEARQIADGRKTHILLDAVGFAIGAEGRLVPEVYKNGLMRKDFGNSKYVWKGDHLSEKVWNAGKNIISRGVSGFTLERAASNPDLKHGLNWSLQTKKQKEAGTGFQTTALGSVALASGGAYVFGLGTEWLSDVNDWERVGDIAHSANNISGNVFGAATIPFTFMIKDPALGLWDEVFGAGLGDNITDNVMSVIDLDNKRLDTEEIDEALAEIEDIYSDAADTAQEQYDDAKEQFVIVKENLRQATRLNNNPDEINRLTKEVGTIEERLIGISQLQVEMEKRHKIIQASIDKVDSNSALGLGIWHKNEKKNLPSAKDAYKKAYDALVDTGIILTLIGSENLTAQQVSAIVGTPNADDSDTIVLEEKTVESTDTQEQERQKLADQEATKAQAAAEKQAQAEVDSKAKLELERIKDTPLGKAKISALAAMTAINGNVATVKSNVTKAEKMLKSIDVQMKTIEDLKKEITAGANSADKQVRINNLDKLLSDVGERRQTAADKVKSLKDAAASAKEIELSAVVLSEEIANIPNTDNQANTDQAIERLESLQMESDISKATSNDSERLEKDVKQLWQSNLNDMNANPDVAESIKTLTPAEQRNKGLRVISGGEDGLLFQALGSKEGEESYVGGLFNTAAGSLKEFVGWWGDVKRNNKSQKEANMYNFAEQGFFGILALWGLGSLPGLKGLSGGMKFTITAGIFAFLAYRSGETGANMRKQREGKNPFAQTDFTRGSDIGTTSDNKASHIPTGKRPFDNMKVSSNNPNPQDISNTLISMNDSTVQGHAGKGIPQNPSRSALPHDIEKALLANISGKSSTSTIDDNTMSMIRSEGALDTINIPYSQVASNDAKHSIRAIV